MCGRAHGYGEHDGRWACLDRLCQQVKDAHVASRRTLPERMQGQRTLVPVCARVRRHSGQRRHATEGRQGGQAVGSAPFNAVDFEGGREVELVERRRVLRPGGVKRAKRERFKRGASGHATGCPNLLDFVGGRGGEGRLRG